MSPIAASVDYFRISEGELLPDFTVYAPYRAIIVSEENCTASWRNSVADWLVRSGCMYVMAWGKDCAQWHDAVDWANIEAFHPDIVPDESHVMTTWHSGESLDEVFWYAQFCATSHLEMKSTLIVHVAPRSSRHEMLARFREAERLQG